MNKGVEILLERMESNPDEFTNEYSTSTSTSTTQADRKWNDIAEKIHMRMTSISQDPETKPYYKYQLYYLTDEEIIALHTKLKDVRAEAFTREIMGRLLGSTDRTTSTQSVPKTMQAPTGAISTQQHHSILAQQKAQKEFEIAQYYNQMGAQNSNGFQGIGAVSTRASTAVDSTWNRVFGKGK
jgi:hypothetical protein